MIFPAWRTVPVVAKLTLRGPDLPAAGKDSSTLYSAPCLGTNVTFGGATSKAASKALTVRMSKRPLDQEAGLRMFRITKLILDISAIFVKPVMPAGRRASP